MVSPFVTAGFQTSDGLQSFRAYVEDGLLGRALAQLCILAQGTIDLSFVLERHLTTGLRIHFAVAGESVAMDLPAPGHEDVATGLGAILKRLNAELRARHLPHRFVFAMDGIALVDPKTAAWLVASGGWDTELSLDAEPAVAPEPPAEGGALPRLRAPQEVVPPRFHYLADPSHASLLARHAQRLAAFAGLRHVSCRAAGSLDQYVHNDSIVSLEILERLKDGGFAVQTLQIPLRPQLNLQPLYDCLNALGGRRARRLYRCASEPWGEHAVLATDEEAAALRALGHLLEFEPAPEVRQHLERAGFAPEGLFGSWKRAQLARCLRWTVALARGRFDVSFEIGDEEGGTLPVHTSLAGRSFVRGFSTEDGAADALARFYLKLNRYLAAYGIGDRFVLIGSGLVKGERVVLLPPAWLEAMLGAPGLSLACLDVEAEGLVRAPGPTRWPPFRATEVLPRLPELHELVPGSRRLESDFKCTVLPSDLVEVIQRIAGFAGLEVSCDAGALAPGGAWVFEVACEGTAQTLRLADEKYAQVLPIVDLLNGIQAQRKKRMRLYAYRAGGDRRGVLLAAASEAEVLRGLGYLEESESPLAVAPQPSAATGTSGG